MKKISMLSLIAVLAATPMMAEAARGVSVVNYNSGQDVTANTSVASTSYVQGAYKAASDRIDALVTDTNVASSGLYIDANESVAHNLGKLDTAVANLAQSTTDVIGGLDADLSTQSSADDGIDMRLVETDGKVTSISANIKDNAVTTGKINDAAVTTAKIADSNVTTSKIADGAVTTGKIENGTILVEDMNESAVVTAEDGIAAAGSATDDRLVTEAAVRSAIDTINSAADNLASVVGNKGNLTGDAAGASTIVDAINAVDDAMKNQRLTVYTTWGQNLSSEIALAPATPAAEPEEPANP